LLIITRIVVIDVKIYICIYILNHKCDLDIRFYKNQNDTEKLQ